MAAASPWQPILRDDLVEIIPLSPEDFESLFAIASDPLIWEQHPNKERATREGFRPFFEEAIEKGMAFRIVDRKTQEVIGSSRYHVIDGYPDVIEIGWTFLARKCWGGKYNSTVKKLMIDHAFEHVNEIIFIVDRNNVRSQRAVEKLGCEKFDGGKMLASRLPEKNFFYKLGRDKWNNRK
jgi:RimJ/RimL family protein N-acetyltransferase